MFRIGKFYVLNPPSRPNRLLLMQDQLITLWFLIRSLFRCFYNVSMLKLYGFSLKSSIHCANL